VPAACPPASPSVCLSDLVSVPKLLEQIFLIPELNHDLKNSFYENRNIKNMMTTQDKWTSSSVNVSYGAVCCHSDSKG
jgi:hypothetical protein